MDIIIHNHYAHDSSLDDKINLIIKQLEIMETKQNQINATLSELNDASNALAAKIQKFIDAGADNVTQESLDQLQVVADNLKAMGTDAAAPLPA